MVSSDICTPLKCCWDKILVVLFCIISAIVYYYYAGGERQYEIMAYKRAAILFDHQIDPYKKTNFDLPLVAEVGAYTQRDLAVWNPPTIFVGLKPWLILDIDFLAQYWVCISLLCAFGAVCLLHSLYAQTDKVFTALCCIAIVTSAVAFRMDIAIGQMASVLSFIGTLAVVFYLKRYLILSGLLLSILIIKPHVFSLVFLALILLSLRRGCGRFIFGLVIGILFQVVLAEILFPGIWKLWIFREEWPFQKNIGASLGSLLSTIPHYGVHWLSYIPFCILSIYVAAKVLANKLIHNYLIEQNVVALAMIASPLASPYGFVFDQMISISGVIMLICWHQGRLRILPCLFLLPNMLVFLVHTFANGKDWNQLMLIFEMEASVPAIFFIIGLYCYRQQEKMIHTFDGQCDANRSIVL